MSGEIQARPPAGEVSRGRRGSFKRLLALTLFITFDLIMFGAFVRVSDSGLGCPDWPGCYGKVTPLGAMADIRAEASARPDGPVTVFKAWVEMLHRYIASALGLLIIGLTWLAWRERKQRRERDHWQEGGQHRGSDQHLESDQQREGDQQQGPTWRRGQLLQPAGASVGLALFTLAWVILQGIFGMWTVTLRLQPAIVTAHLLGGIFLFALLLMQWNRISAHPPVTREAARFRGWAIAGLALLFIQIALGGWVSSNYATLACRDFPACQGSFWPEMDIAAGFEIWRPLGVTADGLGLPFAAVTAIHYAHRLMAYVVLAVVGLLAWRVRRLTGLERIGNGLLVLLLAQVVTGLTTIFLGWPMAAAVLHTAGATALVGGLLMLNFRSGAGRRLPLGRTSA